MLKEKTHWDREEVAFKLAWGFGFLEVFGGKVC